MRDRAEVPLPSSGWIVTHPSIVMLRVAGGIASDDCPLSSATDKVVGSVLRGSLLRVI